jgi:hypothetical protein
MIIFRLNVDPAPILFSNPVPLKQVIQTQVDPDPAPQYCFLPFFLAGESTDRNLF